MSALYDETSYYFDELILTLLEKTKAGKLEWRPTADADAYLASVKGLKTYLIKGQRVADESGDARFHFDVVVRDVDGIVELEFGRRTGENSTESELFDAAAHIAARIDERIHRSLELLNSL